MAFVCDIVPFTRVPLSREPSFWYTSDTMISAGALVEVPLSRRAVRGIVHECRPHAAVATGAARLRAVRRVIAPVYMTDRQMTLASRIAADTLTPLGLVYEQFACMPTGRGTPSEDTRVTLPANTTGTAAPDITETIIDTFGTHTTFLLRDTAVTARDALIDDLVRTVRAEDRQLLVILPETLIAELTAARLRGVFGRDSVTVFHGKIAKGAQWAAWQDIAAGRCRVIIGTRKALFLPFADLAAIVIDEEHDTGHKQWDRAPRFDARSVAAVAARIHTCPLVAVSASPRITRTTPTPIAPPRATSPVTIVDMRVAYNTVRGKRRGPIRDAEKTVLSPELATAITDALAAHRQVLLFLNHKGMSAYSLCASCNTLLACPDCDRALVAVAEGHHECLHCTYTTSLFPTCRGCGGMTFRTHGMGTQRIERIIRRLYPTARIGRIDGHAMRGTHAATDMIRALADGAIDILIGTQMALKDWRSDRLAVVGILDADALLSIPDLYADERLYGMIATAAAAVTHGRRAGSVYVQTYHPGYHLFATAAKADYTAFRRSTLAERKALRYPPYWRIVKVVFRHRTADGAAALATQWYDRLQSITTRQIVVGAPTLPLLPKIRGLCRHQLLLRVAAPRSDTPLPPDLANLLATLPPRTIIDIDPVSLV